VIVVLVIESYQCSARLFSPAFGSCSLNTLMAAANEYSWLTPTFCAGELITAVTRSALTATICPESGKSTRWRHAERTRSDRSECIDCYFVVKVS
jgi:hypothetical protein